MQLALFSQTDSRPLPLIVAEKWSFDLRHAEQDGQDYFCTRDWVMGLQNCDEKAAGLLMQNYANRSDTYSSATDHIVIKRLRYDTTFVLLRMALDFRDIEGSAIGAIKDCLVHLAINGVRLQTGAQKLVENFVTGLSPRPVRVTNKSGYVYIIRALFEGYENLCKIGITRSINDRTHRFGQQFPFPHELVMHAWVENARACEADLHARYQDQHVHNEWFRLDGDDLMNIRAILGGAE